jgi:hypothetical protein
LTGINNIQKKRVYIGPQLPASLAAFSIVDAASGMPRAVDYVRIPVIVIGHSGRR